MRVDQNMKVHQSVRVDHYIKMLGLIKVDQNKKIGESRPKCESFIFCSTLTSWSTLIYAHIFALHQQSCGACCRLYAKWGKKSWIRKFFQQMLCHSTRHSNPLEESITCGEASFSVILEDPLRDKIEKNVIEVTETILLYSHKTNWTRGARGSKRAEAPLVHQSFFQWCSQSYEPLGRLQESVWYRRF